MGIKILAENYRVLRKIEWDLPKGVCALVGPNGSGKTTLLDVPALLRDIFEDGVWEGVERHGGKQDLRNVDAEQTSHVKLGVLLGTIDWRLDLLVPGVPNKYEEVISDDGAKIADRSLQTDRYPRDSDKSGTPSLISHLAGYRLYNSYALNTIRANGSESSADTVLLTQGQNIFSVLRAWRDRRATKVRYDFVVEGLRGAFPDLFEDLELELNDGNVDSSFVDDDDAEGTSFGNRVTGRIFSPNNKDKSLPVSYAPSGLLTGLLHLAAVASTERGGIVGIDEPENGLHPYAVKRILGAMREWADEQDLTVLLATHSPMLLDQFKEEPEHLFVMEPGRDVLPARLDEVRNREWLAQFSLGDLYKHGDFGAPLEGAATAA